MDKNTTPNRHVHKGMLSAALLGEALLGRHATQLAEHKGHCSYEAEYLGTHTTTLHCTDKVPNTTNNTSLTATTVFRKPAVQHEACGPTSRFEPPVQLRSTTSSQLLAARRSRVDDSQHMTARESFANLHRWIPQTTIIFLSCVDVCRTPQAR